MAKVSHSSDLTKCRCCGEPLDVWVPPEEQFCCVECEAIVMDPVPTEVALRRETQDFSTQHLEGRRK